MSRLAGFKELCEAAKHGGGLASLILVLGKQFAVIKAMCAAEREEAKKHNVDPWCRIDRDGETRNATGESFLVLKISARDPRVAEQLLSRVCDRIEQSLQYNRANTPFVKEFH